MIEKINIGVLSVVGIDVVKICNGFIIFINHGEKKIILKKVVRKNSI